MGVAVGNLELSRRPIAIVGVARVAKNDVGNEDLVTSQPGRRKEPLEILSGPIGGEWHATAVSTEPTGCLGDEEHPRMNPTIAHAEQAASAGHRRTALAS